MTAPTLLQGDCFEVLQTLDANSVDSCVTDPPYGLSFMGKHWDKGVPDSDIWREVFRVLKPGAHLLSFFGTRTYHRGAVAIEDAGFEIRDQIGYLYGSGFPKSLNISKDIDRQERQRWLKVCKAIDTLDTVAILDEWEAFSKTATSAGLSFAKSETEAGTSTPKNAFAPVPVLLRTSPENSDAVAIIAELNLSEAHHTGGAAWNSVPSNADGSTTESRALATSAGRLSASHEATLAMPDSSVLQSARGWQGENTTDNLKAVEALKTWLGKNKSSRKADTAALCAALTDDLKRITLEQSKTFQSFDTTQQTECASAISATITESTAASLISFTADSLKRKAIDKAAGAEREVIGQRKGQGSIPNDRGKWGLEPNTPVDITAPATDAAKQWDGWGSNLKPAWEPICVARKPLDGTVANNVLTHGVGGINVDGCRVGTGDDRVSGGEQGSMPQPEDWGNKSSARPQRPTGARFPANVIHDGSDEVLAEFAKYGESKSASGTYRNRSGMGIHDSAKGTFGKGDVEGGYADTGTAARFFYTAKASKDDRNDGLWDWEHEDDPVSHPTVKPTSLMRYLVRLVTPKGGLVLDPFAGSGTTLIAAYREDCRSLGIELDPDYFKMAQHRIDRATAQLRLDL